MREKLKLYIDFLFAGAPNTRTVADTKAEILQNTLDKYDDLVAQGKSPEAAYSLAVSGIGDLGEILTGDSPPVQPNPARRSWLSGLMLAGAVMLYILCVIPVILFDDRGVVWMFICIAVATGLLIFRSYCWDRQPDCPEEKESDPPKDGLRKSIHGLLSALTLAAYLAVSFLTQAWYITWVIFPISAALGGIINACFALKGGENCHE